MTERLGYVGPISVKPLAKNMRMVLVNRAEPLTRRACPIHLDVERDHTIELGVGPSGYDVAVQGPNRFWFEATGSAAGAAAEIEVGSHRTSSAQRLQLVLTVSGLAYTDRSEQITLRGHQRRVVPWPTDQGWYDVEVLSPDDDSFRRRLTGHQENGRDSVTP